MNSPVVKGGFRLMCLVCWSCRVGGGGETEILTRGKKSVPAPQNKRFRDLFWRTAKLPPKFFPNDSSKSLLGEWATGRDRLSEDRHPFGQVLNIPCPLRPLLVREMYATRTHKFQACASSATSATATRMRRVRQTEASTRSSTP